MKVLHLDSGMDWRGGQQQVFYLAEGLRKLGVEQHLVLREGGKLAARVQEASCPFSTLPMSSELSPLIIFELSKIVKRFKPTLTHAHDSRTLGMAVVLKILGEKAKLLAARRVAFGIGKNPFWRVKYQWKVERIIAVSRFIRELLIQQGVHPERIEVVYDGYDWKRMEPSFDRVASRRRLGIAKDEWVIGSVGQFTAEKGHESLINGFKELAALHGQARLILVGDGELRGHYQKLIHELQLEKKVLLPGFVSDLSEILPALDLFVFPSLKEGLGSTLLMAMAHRIPVCASRTGGIPELVIEGQTGFLFPPGDSRALAQTLIRGFEERELTESQVQKAFLRIKADFPVERMVTETYKIYTNVLGG